MDIKEIALKLLAKEYPGMRQENQTFMVEFAEALIAEIAKQNKPAVWWNKDTCQFFIGEIDDVERKDLFEPLYTFPPTAEQIANETAEAIARYVNRFINGDGILNEVWISDIESALRNGEYRKYMKGE